MDDGNRVLVLDANQRGALAVTRSLGRRGVFVMVADEVAPTLAGSSRYCQDRWVYSSPRTDPKTFAAEVITETRRRSIGVVLPVGDVTTQVLLEHRTELGGLAMPVPTLASFQQLSDKWQLHELARQLDVPVPRTWLVGPASDVKHALPDIGLPAVCKPRRSRTFVEGRWVSGSVEYVRSVSDAERIIATREWARHENVLVQQYVAGEGHGLFTLYDRGRPVVFFAHRRLREKPPSGGVSVLSESVPIDPKLRVMGERILGAVGWHGVAMLEFKVTPDGSPYLLEVNGRFWGSLQLAIDAGVDFPWLAYRLATGQSLEGVERYAIGVRNRWLLGDVDHLYLQCREPNGWPRKAEALWRFLRPAGCGTRHEVNRLDDLGPAWYELKEYVRRGR